MRSLCEDDRTRELPAVIVEALKTFYSGESLVLFESLDGNVDARMNKATEMWRRLFQKKEEVRDQRRLTMGDMLSPRKCESSCSTGAAVLDRRLF